MVANDWSDLLRFLGDALRSDEAVVAVFLFGSAVTGHVGHESDVDVGILFAEAPAAAARVELRERLSREFGRDVDLVVLNDASPIVVRQALKGVCAFVRDTSALVHFKVRANGAYDDLKRVRRPIELAIVRGLRSDGR
jgi:predicted nucleotidyltransferase